MRYALCKKTRLPLVILIVSLLSAQLPYSVGQDTGAPPNRPEPVQLRPVASAPAAQSAKPAQPSDVPPPTVVLKPGETPGIAFKEPVYDFGRVRAGADVAHEFVFTNTGNGPLEILQVKPACGCTTSGEYERIVQPGQSGKLPFKLSTKGMGGRTSKTIAVHTNAPALESRITLTIEGEVWEPVGFEPKAVTWGRLTAEAAREPGLTKKVTVTNNTEQPADLTNVRSSSPLFAVEPPTVVEPGKKFELIVRIASGLKPGNNNGTIDLSTGVADAPTLSIPLSAYVVADVEATPSGIVLGPDRPALQQRQVSVQNHTKSPVKLSDMQVSNPAVKVTLQETQPGMTYTLTAEIPPDCVLAPEGEKITLKTDCPTVPEIGIPIREIRVPTTLPSPPAPVASVPPAPAASTPPTTAPVATGLPPPAPGTKTPINDVDPVTGKPLTPSSPTLTHKGYAIGFCCAESSGYKGEWERMSEKDKDAFVRKYLPAPAPPVELTPAAKAEPAKPTPVAATNPASPAPAPVATPLPSPAPVTTPLPPPTPVAGPLPPPAPDTKIPINDVDPVTGKPLTPSSPTLVYKGYAIGFCCAQSSGYTGGWERMSEKDKDAFVRKYLK